MSNSKKITDLAAYTDSQVQSNDLLFITDIAAQETKKITAIDIADYAFNAKSASIFNGNYTGSFTGSFTGSLLGTSSCAVTASYALNSSAGTLSGGGTTNYIPIWTNSTTLGSTNDFYSETGYFTSTRDLKIQKANPALFVTGSGLGYVAVRAEYNSSLMLQSAQSASGDAWSLIVNADDANAAPGNPYDIRGTIDLVSYSGSSQFVSKQVTGEATPVSYVMKSRSNGLYFWPEKGAQSLSRDGTFNIGVSPSTINTSSRFTIEVFSGSSASNPQTYHLHKAIEVTYGSSSLTTTFCVSSSGQVYSTGYNVITSSNFAYTSSLKSGSFAVIEDNSIMFLFARSANGTLRSASLA